MHKESAYYRQSNAEVLKRLNTTPQGLSSKEVRVRVEQYGRNELSERKSKSTFSIFLSQFKDTMVIILIIAAGISFAVGEHTDAYVILAIILGNAWLGFSQEKNAEESIRLLQEMSAQYAVAFRDGEHVKLDATELVPGDIILLEAGNIVPADARLLEANALKTDEASLTGESHSVEKIQEPIEAENLVPGDQLNMVFKGTIVSNGTGKAVVTATGMNTELGKIAQIMDIPDQKTPLQQRLSAFSKQLAILVLVICALIFGYGIYRGESTFQMFLTALSLAVAALPEALPAVITIALAQGANRLIKRNALIRKLPAVETLGSVTYICSDKTGTLTQNVMTVERQWVVEGKEDLLHKAHLLNNDVHYAADGSLLGDSTETALVEHAMTNGYTRDKVLDEMPLEGQIPFDSQRMRMSTLHRFGSQYLLLTKGAPSKIAEVVGSEDKVTMERHLERNREWAAEGLRVLFFAYKIFPEKPAVIDESLEKDLAFLGMSAMIDPPREEVIEAIDQCKSAGIKTVMITGDQMLTARAIALRLKMADSEESLEAVTGQDLNKWTSEELEKKVTTLSVYARVSPEQKLAIVKSLQKNGEFVAMTGDGVNDAPSLRQADIGVAMGITGTDVSKEAAEMVLLDDNFSTIVKAVHEGRRIYENIRKFIIYVLSCNLAEILVIVFAPVLGFAIPLLPIHILWINLVTDGLPGLALVGEPPEKDIMRRPPRSPQESLFAGGLLPRIVLTGLVMTLAVLAVQGWMVQNGYDTRTQQTAVFTTLCFVQLVNAHSVRSVFHTLFASDIFTNRLMWYTFLLTAALQVAIVYTPWLQPIFKTTALDGDTMKIILLVSVGSLALQEIIKFGIRKFYYRPVTS